MAGCIIDILDPPPVITQHPMNVTVSLVNDSTNVSLNCEADGALCYIWEREDGAQLSNSIGANNTNLTLIGVHPEDAGYYRCVAINDNGHNKSDDAIITINGKVKWFECNLKTTIICSITYL